MDEEYGRGERWSEDNAQRAGTSSVVMAHRVRCCTFQSSRYHAPPSGEVCVRDETVSFEGDAPVKRRQKERLQCIDRPVAMGRSHRKSMASDGVNIKWKHRVAVCLKKTTREAAGRKVHTPLIRWNRRCELHPWYRPQ
jgi:hypothetical protein